MHNLALVQAMVLIALANSSPLVATLICGKACAWPIDGNVRFFDGRPLLGASKTVRGVVVSLVTTALGAWLIGLALRIGLLVAAAAMAGDLLSSFAKRRLGLSPSSKATGLDQIPESLFPLLACRSALSLSATDIGVGCILFFVAEVLLSRVFFHLRLRERPY
jgi:hypothetical protein